MGRGRRWLGENMLCYVWPGVQRSCDSPCGTIYLFSPLIKPLALESITPKFSPAVQFKALAQHERQKIVTPGHRVRCCRGWMVKEGASWGALQICKCSSPLPGAISIETRFNSILSVCVCWSKSHRKRSVLGPAPKK